MSDQDIIERLKDWREEYRHINDVEEDTLLADAIAEIERLRGHDSWHRELVHLLYRECDALRALRDQGWQPVEGWEEAYEVSWSGEVRKKTGDPVGQWEKEGGYKLVRLSSPRKVMSVHRMVAKAFCANPLQKDCVGHLDNNPRNNSADNLFWCTQQENLAHMGLCGRRRGQKKGGRSPNAKLTDSDVHRIFELRKEGRTHEGIAQIVNSNKKTVGLILAGKRYRNSFPLPQPPEQD